MHMQCWVSLRRNQLSKRDANHSKTALTVLGLEHPSSGALLALWYTATMYHWASQADNIKEMMDYIPHVIRYIPTYTYRYLYIRTYTCIYLHIHAHTCTYPTPTNLKGPYLSDQWADRPEPKNRFNNRPFPTNCAGFWHMKRIQHDMAA